jgi:DNA-binding NarL/FixJ family response regulator
MYRNPQTRVVIADGQALVRGAFQALIEAEVSDVRVIMVSESDEDDQLFGALRAGASAFLAKDTAPAELLEAVRAVAHGDALLSRGVTRRLIAERLVISVATAKTHVSRALRKVDARDRSQLVALAYKTGLVHPRLVALG